MAGMTMANDKKIFETVIDRGLYLHQASVPSGRNVAPRWEVVDLAGELLGRGHDKAEALDQAWVKFQGKR